MQDSLQITVLLHILADNLDDTQGRSRPAAVLSGEGQRHTTIKPSPEMISSENVLNETN